MTTQQKHEGEPTCPFCGSAIRQHVNAPYVGSCPECKITLPMDRWRTRANDGDTRRLDWLEKTRHSALCLCTFTDDSRGVVDGYVWEVNDGASFPTLRAAIDAALQPGEPSGDTMAMQYNDCKTCGARDGRAGTLIDGECWNCWQTRKTGSVSINSGLIRTEDELKRTMAILPAGGATAEQRYRPTGSKITLTVREILDLSKAANLVPNVWKITEDEAETEYTIFEREGGVQVNDDDGTPRFYAHGAFLSEYPEEGTFPLGHELPSPTPQPPESLQLETTPADSAGIERVVPANVEAEARKLIEHLRHYAGLENLDATILDFATRITTQLREQVEKVTRERDKARLRLLSAAGDDLCRLSQEEIKAMSAGAVKIPPKEEFLASCERFHAQVAGESGVLTNCLTLAQLIAENETLRAELVAERDDAAHWQERFETVTADRDKAITRAIHEMLNHETTKTHLAEALGHLEEHRSSLNVARLRIGELEGKLGDIANRIAHDLSSDEVAGDIRVEFEELHEMATGAPQEQAIAQPDTKL